MKIAEVVNICPYPGLRSFTEEESLFFKGRDLQVDQISSLLEQNKFLMVTGASGEGKSSLIYGGLIPNARAGFFRAKYSNWVVASFRPERTPVENMAHALAEPLQLNPQTVETELRRGYSSLVDLYTNSDFFFEEEDSEHLYSEKEQKEKKRKAANLLILVDQFEEFFTNPENFYNEAPSKDAQTVVNLVLETSRIAIKRNLPVYIICTMRSDYIGQCSAFRGLPEYIGFSQFFVPRLKRKDLKQVIEEPAILSGNKISQRLIERLVYDVAEGVDQLPILQHALNQVWLAAQSGSEEMDLVHYAMAGGMPPDELPDEDLERFNAWFTGLPEHHRGFYKTTGLHKVIEIHANLLYENAWQYHNQHQPENPVTQQEAKRVIALAFSCLTKIDNSRAVRNRMTLAEITAVINSPKITPAVVGGILNIFREEGNSFIHPFKTTDPSTHLLHPDTVLDITHESLIRNWNKLNKWATTEFDFYTTYLDFRKQLNRWKSSGKKSGYLLPLGPLTFFEAWYQQCKPNAAWIMRYAETTEDKQLARTDAEEVLNDTKSFLKQSAARVRVTRTFMKYGARRVAVFFAVLIMLILTGFYGFDADQKKNERIIGRVRNESKALLLSQEVNVTDKAIYLLTEERYSEGSLLTHLQSLEFKSQVKLAIETYKQLLLYDKRGNTTLKDKLFASAAEKFSTEIKGADIEFMLTEANKFIVLVAMDVYYNPNQQKQAVLSRLADGNYNRVLEFYRNLANFKPGISYELNLAIQYWLTFGTATPQQIETLLLAISPAEGGGAEAAFNTYYTKGSLEPNGRQPMDFNGGYHTIASLYAAAGNIEKVEWCFGELINNNQREYFELARVLNNHLNVLGYLYQFRHRQEVPRLLQWIASNTNDNPPLTLLRNTVIRSGYVTHLYKINYDRDFYRSTRGYIYPNLYFADRKVFDEMASDYDSTIRRISDGQERTFQLAMNNKRKAVFYHKYYSDRNLPADTAKLNAWLNEAITLFKTLDQNYLNGEIPITVVYNGDGVRVNNVKRKDVFIYPDYRDGWFSWSFHSDYLFNYLHSRSELKQLYANGSDLRLLHMWLAKAFEVKADISQLSYSNTYTLPDKTILNLLQFVNSHPEGKEFDANLPHLLLANRYFEAGDSSGGLKHFHLIDQQTIRRSSDQYEYLEKTFFRNELKRLCVNLAKAGRGDLAATLAEKYAIEEEKVFAYLHMAENVYRTKTDPYAFVFLDSAYAKSRKVDYTLIQDDFDPRYAQILLLSEIGSNKVNKSAASLLRDIPEYRKFQGIVGLVQGVAFEGNYHRAYTAIPPSLTESQDLNCRSILMLEACKEKELAAGETKWKAMDEYLTYKWNYINYFPN